MIDKETFIDTINLLEVMVKSNKRDNETIHLLRTILKLLPLFFSDKEQAKLQIEEYCFELNFGKPSIDAEYITPGQLYEQLV